MIELAMASLVIMSFVMFSINTSLSVFDVSRSARAAGMAGEMVHQIFAENANPAASSLDLVPTILRNDGYIDRTEDHRMVVSVIEYTAGTGHVRTSLTYHGPNTTQSSKVLVRTDAEAEPGVHIGDHIYTLLSGEKLYVVELFTGRRGNRAASGGGVPFYEMSVFLDGA
jgi:hypothetical protein